MCRHSIRLVGWFAKDRSSQSNSGIKMELTQIGLPSSRMYLAVSLWKGLRVRIVGFGLWSRFWAQRSRIKLRVPEGQNRVIAEWEMLSFQSLLDQLKLLFFLIYSPRRKPFIVWLNPPKNWLCKPWNFFLFKIWSLIFDQIWPNWRMCY